MASQATRGECAAAGIGAAESVQCLGFLQGNRSNSVVLYAWLALPKQLLPCPVITSLLARNIGSVNMRPSSEVEISIRRLKLCMGPLKFSLLEEPRHA